MEPVVIPNLYDIVDVQANRGYSIALNREGRLYVWVSVNNEFFSNNKGR
jgi:hypothetical protein